MNTQDLLSALKKKIEIELDIFLSNKAKEGQKVNHEIKNLIEAIHDFTLRGGKRLRAIFMILIFEGLSKKEEELEEIIRVSIVWELLQSYLLIHDDIIDNDSLRRGGPTMHIKLSDYFQDKHQGISQSILTGDLLALWSNELLIDYGFKHNNYKFVKYVNEAICKVIHGEMLDVLDWRKESNFTERIETIHDLKTVCYTTSGPIIAGAILAGTDEDNLKLINEFSKNLGLAFQIKDDLLGVFGDSEKTGKPITSDIEEGKLTHLIAYTLKNGSSKDLDFLNKCLKNTKITMKEFEHLKSIFEENGAKDYSENLVNSYSKEALNYLEKITMKDETKKHFAFIVDYLINRKY